MLLKVLNLKGAWLMSVCFKVASIAVVAASLFAQSTMAQSYSVDTAPTILVCLEASVNTERVLYLAHDNIDDGHFLYRWRLNPTETTSYFMRYSHAGDFVEISPSNSTLNCVNKNFATLISEGRAFQALNATAVDLQGLVSHFKRTECPAGWTEQTQISGNLSNGAIVCQKN